MFKTHTFYLTIVLALFSFYSFGITYTTTGNNSWSPSNPGNSYSGSDDFIINHTVTLKGFTLENGGSLIIKSGGYLKTAWSLSFKNGSTVQVDNGGTLKISQLTCTNYSSNFNIDGKIITSNGTLANYQSGVINYNEGAEWTFNQMSFVNYGTLTLNEDLDWKNGSVAFSLGTVTINKQLSIKNLSLSNNAAIEGIGQVEVLNGNGTFSSNGTINGCSGNSCIPPSTVGNTTYLYYHSVPNGGDYTPVTGGTISNSNCSEKIIVLEDSKISSDVNVGTVLVSPGVRLEIESNRSLIVCNEIENQGEIIVKNKGSIVQTNAVDLNSGDGIYSIEVKGSSNQNAYNSWSSPFRNAAIKDMFPNANECDIFAFEGATQSWKYDYPANYQGNCNGNTVTFPASIVLPSGDGIMDVGSGYFVPGTNSVTRTVSGKVNNGEIEVSIYETPLGPNHNPLWQDDDWNLVGNPYPCAIDLDLFLDENKNVILGSFYFWVDDNQNGTDYHHSEDYSVFANGAGTTANGGTAKRYVGAGQAFWVYAKSDDKIRFTNSMRVAGNNSNLFKTDSDLPPFVYLSVTNDSLNNNQCAIGFNEDATDLYDEFSDAAKSATGTGVAIGSLIGNLPYSIQALEPINENETKSVPLFLTTSNAGIHVFKADSFQNMGGEYAIYLNDHVTGDLINLKKQDYSLYLDTGNYVGRFTIDFENNGTPTGINSPKNVNSNLQAYQSGDEIIVQLIYDNQYINEVYVYDMVGKQVYFENQKGQIVRLDGSNFNAGIYVIKVILDNGEEVSLKIPISK
ncbi:MAG: T9SS type A sorting domain-containing protein [Salibacteraceae bacterium]